MPLYLSVPKIIDDSGVTLLNQIAGSSALPSSGTCGVSKEAEIDLISLEKIGLDKIKKNIEIVRDLKNIYIVYLNKYLLYV
tara:strand:- start:1857 stop:2099 length:243 start_codon:yes stop_codon:yes gene_type:complete